MATLEEPSLLLQTGSGNGVIGVSRAVEDDCIVVTRKRDVEVMNVSLPRGFVWRSRGCIGSFLWCSLLTRNVLRRGLWKWTVR